MGEYVFVDIESRPAPRRPAEVLLATIPSDAHMWNLVYLQLKLEERGCIVNNLGQCTPIEEICSEALVRPPDAIVISSVNGHGYLEGVQLGAALRAHRELAATRMIIGGKLGVAAEANIRHAGDLIDAGFDVVLEASGDPRAADRLVQLIATPSRTALTGSIR